MPVWYIDYSADDPPVPTAMAPFRYKRKSFSHEKELRALVYAEFRDKRGNLLPPPGDNGIRLRADLATLIEEVYVAPTAPKWFVDLLRRVCKRFKVKARVVQSSLATEQPSFI